MEYRGLVLDDFQAKAIEALDAGRSVLVCAPTGTGKTVVADWCVEQALGEGRRVIYTAPIKALSNQKFRDYCSLFGDEAVGLVTGDLVIRREAPCRVMTTEILRNMLLTGDQLEDLAAVVLDEIHFLDDYERGTTWEEVLIYLPPGVQVVGLSATLSNASDFAEWLSQVRDRPVEVVTEHQRAVPLHTVIATREGGLRDPADMDAFAKRWAKKNAGAMQRARQRAKRRGGGRRWKVAAPTRHTDLFDMLVPDELPYLYFVFSRSQTEKLSHSLVNRMERRGQSLLSTRERADLDERLDRFRELPGAETALDADLVSLYRSGIGYHHAGLHVMLKGLVERLYEARLIKVLYCTGTFALGINMPARAAVFDNLERYDGRGMIPLPTREFMQMAGRAGRRGMDEVGVVVVRTDLESWPELAPQLKRYLSGRYEPVHSRFSLSFNSVVNLLHRHSRDQVRTLVESSFLSYYRTRQVERTRRKADELQSRLEKAGWTNEGPTPPALKREVKQFRKIEGRADRGADQTWKEFEQKVRFLEKWGYLEPDGTFNAGARVLLHVQIAEIFTTELFLEGLFEDITMPVLFGVLCGMCHQLPVGARVRAGREHKRLLRAISEVRGSEVVQEAERLTRGEVDWDPDMVPLGRWWAEGRSLAEIVFRVQSRADSSGDLVGAFRRAKDLAGQLREIWRETDPGRAEAVADLVRRVSRDEVEVVD